MSQTREMFSLSSGIKRMLFPASWPLEPQELLLFSQLASASSKGAFGKSQGQQGRRSQQTMGAV